jgi:hypothetical protein
MALKIIERIKFSLTGRAVPAIKVADEGPGGKVLSLQILGSVKMRPNSMVSTWDQKGWEIDQEHPGHINIIDEKGNAVLGRVVSAAGRTCDLYAAPYLSGKRPDREDVIGKAATMDDIADAMDLGKSMKNLGIGIIIGLLVGASLAIMFGAH